MTTPARKAGRERQVALMLLTVGVVLLFSSVSWFSSGQTGVGIAQVVVGAAVAGAGFVLLRRVGRSGPVSRGS